MRAPLLLLVVCLGVAGAATPAPSVNTHNGEIRSYSSPHYTVPPTATNASLASSEACVCSDADPRADATLLVTYNCYHQALYGNCNASFMANFLAELVETDGFCQISCGRCDCCTSAWDVIQKTGNTRFLQAVTATNSSLEAALKTPGWTSTMLVPSDAAFNAALAKYPALLQDSGLLLELIKFHILPPEPRTRGLWTTPFMAVGAELFTMYDGNATIKTGKMALPSDITYRGGLTGITLTGPVNSATITESDLRACKTVVDVIDTVLWPFDPVTVSAANGDVGTAIGAPGFTIAANSQLNGTLLSNATEASLTDCSNACNANAQCNVFTYCPEMGGCRLPDGTTYPYATCDLIHSPEVAAGQPPAYGNSGVDSVPMVSGYKPGSSSTASAGRR